MAPTSQNDFEQETVRQWLREKCISFNSKDIRKSSSRPGWLEQKRKYDAKINLIESQVADLGKYLKECKKSLEIEAEKNVKLENLLKKTKKRVPELQESNTGHSEIPSKVVLLVGNDAATHQKLLDAGHLMKFAENVMRILEFTKCEKADLPQQLELLTLHLERKFKTHKILCSFLLSKVEKSLLSRNVTKQEKPPKCEDYMSTPSSSASLVTPPISYKIFPSPPSTILDRQIATSGSPKVLATSDNELKSMELHDHVNMTTKKIKLSCEFCHKKYRFKSELNFHMKRCQLGKCQSCGECFGTKEKQKTHSCPRFPEPDDMTFSSSQQDQSDTMETEEVNEDISRKSPSSEESNHLTSPAPSCVDTNIDEGQYTPGETLDSPILFALSTQLPEPSQPLVTTELTTNKSSKMNMNSDNQEGSKINSQGCPEHPENLVFLARSVEQDECIDVEARDSSNPFPPECSAQVTDEGFSSSSTFPPPPTPATIQPLTERRCQTAEATQDSGTKCESCGERLGSQNDHFCHTRFEALTKQRPATNGTVLASPVTLPVSASQSSVVISDPRAIASPERDDDDSNAKRVTANDDNHGESMMENPLLNPSPPVSDPGSTPPRSVVKHGVHPEKVNTCICGVVRPDITYLELHIDIQNR